MPVSGIGSLNRNIKRVTQVEISPLNDRDNTFDLSCLVIPKITENLPVKSFDKRRLNLPNLRLADPSFNKSGPIDLLLGADVFWSVMLPESVKANHSHPHLQNTQLGWSIGGSIAESQSNLKTCANLAITLQEQVARFWEIEQVTTTGPPRTRVEAWCEEHFLKTYAREPNGKFVVRLPFKQNVSKLRGSKDIATKRFLQLERNLMRQPTLRSDYVKFMAEYLKLGHMSPVTNIDAFRCYLPHHCVVKESSTTTKVRVVFDGSCKTNSGISLNETLLVGPTIQPDLVTILLRFRSHQYVFSADIAKMYRQVWVHPDDRRYQTILWRENPNQPIIEYELNTVTYGTTSAPFLAIKVLQHIAQLHQDQYPLACKHILEDFYVDDLLTGADSIEQLQKIRTEITRVVADAGFELRKWNSNDPSLIAEQALGPTSQLIIDKQDTKSLGVTWNAHKDEIKYSFQLKSNTTVTKRSILSVIAQLFDPLGLLGPVILKAKLLLQQIWALKLNWDDRVPESIESTWLYFVDSLPAVSSLSIPRSIKCREPVKVEIHGFCDASKDAYGAVIYIRSLDATGVYHNNLLCSKLRVALLKATTIPQLELCAALLLAKSYVAVFVCFSTKAIHLELVSDCTSDSFLAAFRRFISRRGNVTTMYSDNGTNFVGANKELQTLKQLFKDSQFQQELFSESLKYNTNWKFIPANSPHWGGLWEAGVKSVKGHIKRVVGDTSLTFEEMYTFLTQVEACVNSRPITQLSTDPNDLIPLTPGHFLIGDRLTTVLEPDLTPIRLNRLSRWQLVQQLQQHFWRRWSSEYLHHLQQRSKWQDKTDKPFKVGSLVLLCDDNLPPLQWKLGRIQELHPGSDGLVRAVTVKTLTGSVRRAINRISILIE
jgi:hypothetical protein